MIFLDNDEVIVIDNFLDTGSFSEIQELMMGNEFPWYWNDTVTYKPNDIENYCDNPRLCDEIYNSQLTHIFYSKKREQSKYYPKLLPILTKLNCKGSVRVKANLNPVTVGERIEHAYHSGNSYTPYTAIYYLNTNNGYTIFEDGTIVESVENRMMVFKTPFVHSGTTCSDQKRRVVINFNYF